MTQVVYISDYFFNCLEKHLADLSPIIGGPLSEDEELLSPVIEIKDREADVIFRRLSNRRTP